MHFTVRWPTSHYFRFGIVCINLSDSFFCSNDVIQIWVKPIYESGQFPITHFRGFFFMYSIEWARGKLLLKTVFQFFPIFFRTLSVFSSNLQLKNKGDRLLYEFKIESIRMKIFDPKIWTTFDRKTRFIVLYHILFVTELSFFKRFVSLRNINREESCLELANGQKKLKFRFCSVQNHLKHLYLKLCTELICNRNRLYT